MVTPQKLVVHELQKEVNVNQANIFLSNELAPINDTVSKLVNNLHESYRTDKLTYAIFDPESNDTFPAGFHNYTNADYDDNEFLKFTQNATETLSRQIRNVTASKGGYLTFCEYHVNNDRFLGVFLIRDTEGLIFNRDRENNAVQIDTITYLDTNKLAMGCRINYSKYITNSGKYLTFMRRQTTMSEYFLNWVAAAQPESSKEFTQTLYRMITQMPKPIDPDTNEEYDTNKFRDKAKDVIKDNNGNVNLELIGNYFYEDENALINYRDENNFELDNEFRADKRELNKFSQVDIKGEGIHLKFSRGDLGTGKVRTGQQNYIVIESQRLYEALIEEERENG